MESSDFGIDEQEAFAARMQLGSLLGTLKDWSVTFSQVPTWIGEILSDWDSLEVSADDFKNTLEKFQDFFVNGLTALINIIQENATTLYGEPFPEDSFKHQGIEMVVRRTDDIIENFTDLPKQHKEHLLGRTDLPEDIKELLMKMMEAIEEEGDDNE